MNKNISLNLLPIEYLTSRLKDKKFYKVQIIGTSVVLVLIFLSSLTFALGIFQSQNIKQVQASLSNTESKIAGYKNVEGSLIIVKNRLQVISQFGELPSKQRESFEKIVSIIPSEMLISSFNVDSSGNVLITVISPTAQLIDEMMEKVLSASEYKFIAKLIIDSLNRGRDGLFRATLKFEITR